MHQTSSLNNFFFLVDRRYFLLSFPSVCSITRYIAAPEILVCSENGHKQLRDSEIDRPIPSKREPGKQENFKYILRTNDKSLKLILLTSVLKQI